MSVQPVTDLPLRQITRLRTEMAISAAALTGAMFPDQPMLGIEYGIVARISLPDWCAGGALARPAETSRAITIRRMALSLGSPAETTRRHVRQLVERGVLATCDDGVALATTPEATEVALLYYRAVHDLFVRLVEDISVTCDLDLPVGDAPAFAPGDIVERALEVLLLPIDTTRPLKNRMAFLLWGALTAAAVRGVTYDPVLCRRHAAEIPPDAIRAGVSLRRIATLLSIPYATAWRQIATLERDGLATRVGDGWTVLTANLVNPAVAHVSSGPSLHLYRKVRELALMGLDPRRAADRYLGVRPALADFGLGPIQSGAKTDCRESPRVALDAHGF